MTPNYLLPGLKRLAEQTDPKGNLRVTWTKDDIPTWVPYIGATDKYRGRGVLWLPSYGCWIAGTPKPQSIFRGRFFCMLAQTECMLDGGHTVKEQFILSPNSVYQPLQWKHSLSPPPLSTVCCLPLISQWVSSGHLTTPPPTCPTEITECRKPSQEYPWLPTHHWNTMELLYSWMITDIFYTSWVEC